jgi:hypothetical protein
MDGQVCDAGVGVVPGDVAVERGDDLLGGDKGEDFVEGPGARPARDETASGRAFTEAVTRLADRSGDAVPDDLWDEVADHFDERQLSALILLIGVTNMFNRLNATIKEPAGASWN